MHTIKPAPTVPRRRLWPWVLGIGFAPLLLLGIAVANVLTLDRDAAILRQHVMAATNSGWDTRIQLNVGSLTLGAVRQCLWFVHDQNVANAHLALKAVKHASIGVYERHGDRAGWSRDALFADTDRAMRKRGWSRLLGVADHGDTVLVYVSDVMDSDDPLDVCVAAVNDRELVVVSTAVDAEGLRQLIEKKAGEDIRRSLRIAWF